MKLLLFDIDGTLLLAGGAGAVAMERAFSELFSVANTWNGMQAHGRTDPLLFEEISRRHLGRSLKVEETAALSRRYLRLLEDELRFSTGFRVLPGVKELCSALCDMDDFLLGIETGNFEQAAILKLRRGGLERYFRSGAYGSDSPHRPEIVRLAIERARVSAGFDGITDEVVVIGDAPQDVLAARTCGARCLAVATGPASARELAALGPNYVLDDLSDTRHVISLLRG